MTQKRSQSSSKFEENQWKNIANQFKGENIERCTCIHGINIWCYLFWYQLFYSIAQFPLHLSNMKENINWAILQ